MVAFAAAVKAAVALKPWGLTAAGMDAKAFISDVATILGVTDLDTLKEMMWECHKAGLLEMARCDLVQAADNATLQASEWRVFNATFHVVYGA